MKRTRRKVRLIVIVLVLLFLLGLTIVMTMPMQGSVRPIAILLVVLFVLGIVLGVKPIRQKIFRLINKPTTQVTSAPSPKSIAPAPAPTQAPGAPTSPSVQPPIVGNKSDRYGINTGMLVPEEPYFNAAMDYAAALGVGWIRIGGEWSDLEREDNQFNFSVEDKHIDTVRSKGLNILYSFDPDLNGSFCSVAPGGGLKQIFRKKPRCSDEQFKDYITQIVIRYKGRVSYYELGNEPDLRSTWRDHPEEYARALALAYPALKAADQNAKLLIGGLARGGQNNNPQYLEKLIEVGALSNFDIYNYHTYSKKEDITSEFNRVKSMMGGKPIWITEVGYSSEGGRVGYPYPAGEDGQAEYLKDILPHILNLGVEKVFWYTLVDVPREGSGEFCTYGLTYIPGKQCLNLNENEGRKVGGELKTKKAFDAYKALTQ